MRICFFIEASTSVDYEDVSSTTALLPAAQFDIVQGILLNVFSTYFLTAIV